MMTLDSQVTFDSSLQLINNWEGQASGLTFKKVFSFH